MEESVSKKQKIGSDFKDFLLAFSVGGAATTRNNSLEDMNKPVSHQRYIDFLKSLSKKERDDLLKKLPFLGFCMAIAVGEPSFLKKMMSFHSVPDRRGIIKYNNYQLLRFVSRGLIYNKFCLGIKTREKLSYLFALVRKDDFFLLEHRFDIYQTLFFLALSVNNNEIMTFILAELKEEQEKLQFFSANNYALFIQSARHHNLDQMRLILSLLKEEDQVKLLVLACAWLDTNIQTIEYEYHFTRQKWWEWLQPYRNIDVLKKLSCETAETILNFGLTIGAPLAGKERHARPTSVELDYSHKLLVISQDYGSLGIEKIPEINFIAGVLLFPRIPEYQQGQMGEYKKIKKGLKAKNNVEELYRYFKKRVEDYEYLADPQYYQCRAIHFPKISRLLMEEELTNALAIKFSEPDQQKYFDHLNETRSFVLWANILDVMHYSKLKTKAKTFPGNYLHASWLSAMRPLISKTGKRNFAIAQLTFLVRDSEGRKQPIKLPIKMPDRSIFYCKDTVKLKKVYSRYKDHARSLFGIRTESKHVGSDLDVCHSEKVLLLWLHENVESIIEFLKKEKVTKLYDIVLDILSLNQMCYTCRQMFVGFQNGRTLVGSFIKTLEEKLTVSKNGIRMLTRVSAYQELNGRHGYYKPLHGTTPEYDGCKNANIITSDQIVEAPLPRYPEVVATDRKKTLGRIVDESVVIKAHYQNQKVKYMGQQMLSIKQLTVKRGRLVNSVILCATKKTAELYEKTPNKMTVDLSKFSLICSGTEAPSKELIKEWKSISGKSLNHS